MISRTAARRKISPPRQGRSNPVRPNVSAIDHAVRVVHSVCCLAGSASLIDDLRADLRAEGIPAAIRRHDTATLFDWLMAAFSYQGILTRSPPSTWSATVEPNGTTSTPRLPPVPPALSSQATGIFTVAGTTRSAGHVRSPITSTDVPYRPTTCAMVGLTRWPIRYSCSFATLLTAIWSAGSTDNSKLLMTQPTPIGSPDCGKP